MRYLIIYILSIVSMSSAFAESEAPTAQIPQDPILVPPPANQRFVQQKRNEQLAREVQTLRFFRDWVFFLEKRLEDIQQKCLEAVQKNQEMELQLKENEKRFQDLLKERTALADQLQQREEQMQQLDIQKRHLHELQVNLDKANEDINKTRASYDEKIQTLQRLEDSAKNNAKQIAWLNDQILGKNKKIADLSQQLDQYDRQQHKLTTDKIQLEQKLQDKTKQLNNLETTYLQTQDGAKVNETRMQSDIDAKAAAILKWRKDYDMVKSQLDTAININKELRQQNAALERQLQK
jgi:chromosome segregation ATPase